MVRRNRSTSSQRNVRFDGRSPSTGLSTQSASSTPRQPVEQSEDNNNNNNNNRNHYSNNTGKTESQLKSFLESGGVSDMVDENGNAIVHSPRKMNGRMAKVDDNGNNITGTASIDPANKPMPRFMETLASKKEKQEIDANEFKRTISQLWKLALELEELVKKESVVKTEEGGLISEIRSYKKILSNEKQKCEEELIEIPTYQYYEAVLSEDIKAEITKENCARIYTYSFGRLRKARELSDKQKSHIKDDKKA